MNTRAFATIALKVLGIYVLLQFLGLFPMALSMFQLNFRTEELSQAAASPVGDFLLLIAIYVAAISLAYLGCAAILFFGASRLSRFLVKDTDGQIVLAGPISDDVLTLAFRCLGVYALVTWAPNLIETFTRTIIYGTWYTPQVPFLKRFYDNGSVLVSPSIGSLFGLLLIFRAKGLLRLIQLSRPMAREQIEQ